MSDDDICGHPTPSGPCQNPATEDGHCWIDDHGGDVSLEGRPSKFNEERRDAAIEGAREGKSKAGCARAAGVDKSTLNDWLEKHADFRHAFMRARATGESQLIEGGLYDEDVNPSMAKFLLASSFGYQKSQEVEVGGDGLTINLPDDATDF